MIEKAYVSGQIAKAVYIENGKYYSIDLGSFDTPMLCRAGDINLYYNCGADFTGLINKELTLNSIKEYLEQETVKYKILTLSLSGMDEELSDETRIFSIEVAEEYLSDNNIFTFVHSRLLAYSLPDDADIDKALIFSEKYKHSILHSLYKQIQKHQNVIYTVKQIWQEVSYEYLINDQERMEGEKLFINSGSLAKIVTAVAEKDKKKLQTLVVTLGLEPELKKMSYTVQILNEIIKRLLKDSGSFNQIANDNKRDHDVNVETKSIDPIIELIDESISKKNQPKDKKVKTQTAKKNVDKQIKAIEKLIRKGKMEKSQKYLYDLIKYNLMSGKKKHVAMTLCSLAKKSLNYNQTNFAEQLVEYAFRLHIEDVVIWTSKAEVLKALGKYDKALLVYDNAIKRFSNNVVLVTSRAEVLKLMGRLDEALIAFENTIIQFPNEVVPAAGRAEVLKAMGRFDEALAAYEKTIRQFPNDIFPANGRAEVLKVMGRYDDALTFYEKTIKQFPDEVVPANGRAEVLKLMGRYDDALTFYEKTIKQFPDEVVPANGRAEVLKVMGRYDDALTFFEKTIKRFPNDVFSATGRAEVLKLMGRYDKALAFYEKTSKLFPNDVVAATGRAEVLKAMGRFDDALTFYEEIKIRFPYNKFILNGLLNLYILIGKDDKAEKMLFQKEPVFEQDWIQYHITAMFYLKRGQIDEAIKRLSFGVEKCKNDMYKNYFISSLAVARLKKKEFDEVQQLEKYLTKVEGFQQQVFNLFLSHSLAGSGKNELAIDRIAKIRNTENQYLLNLQNDIIKRYNLQEERVFSESELDELDKQIEEKEFFLLMAA